MKKRALHFLNDNFEISYEDLLSKDFQDIKNVNVSKFK